MSSILSILLAMAVSCAAMDAAALVPVPTLQPSLPAAGLEPNRGQANQGILFLSPGGSSSIAVTAQSVLYSPLGATLTLLASNPNPVVSYADPLPGLVNSYSGANPQKWVTGVPRYATADLAAVYPGIDAQYIVGTDGGLTLNLLCQPGVDPKAVTFEIALAVQMVQGSDGSLFVLFSSPAEYSPSMYYAAPLAYQTTASGQVSRGVSFVVQSTTQFGLVVQGLDATLPLQIAMKLGSYPNYLAAPAIPHTVDSAGNAFFAATIADPAGKPAPFGTPDWEGCGADDSYPIPCLDVAVYKYSAAGLLVFVTYLSGETRETAQFLGLAPDGALAVAGTTDSADFPVTAAALQPAYAGPAAVATNDGSFSGDFFAAILDPATGLLRASTYLGGPDGDTMGTAALGADGSLYFMPVWLGSFSAGMPVTSGSLQASCQGNPCVNGYVARLSPALDKLIYGTYLPGTVQTTAELYSDGSVYYSGTAGPGFPTTPGAYQGQNAGGYNGIIARLDPTGSRLLFATYFGGPDTDWILRMAVAPDGSVWAAVDSFVECCIDIQFQLIHLDANGANLLAQLPISVDDMVVDAAGNLIALAYGDFTVSPDAFLASSCGTDAYIELSPSGQQMFATYMPADFGGFDGVTAQGTPILLTASGPAQVVEGQSMGAFAGCVVDAATLGNAEDVSPGAIVTIFGSALGPNPGVGFQLANGQVPVSLGGTQVLVNGTPAPILYSSYWQLNVILPYSLPVRTPATIQVVSNGAESNQLSNLDVQQAGFSLFRVGNAAAALNQDGTVNSPQNPAQPGSTVMLFGTGGGQTVPPSVAGEVTPLALFPLASVPIAQIPGGPTLTVEYAGGAPGLVSGVDQINVTLPDVIPVVPGYPSGSLPLVVAEGDFVAGIVTISVVAN
ncbi:MAG: hypothetical protein ACLQKA_15325 [Bryobacteraceae bacterium]